MSEERALKWCMPASVLNALWGTVMPRLAATLWKGDMKMPPDGATEDQIGPRLIAARMEDEALDEFWNGLARISFGKVDNYTSSKKGQLSRALKDKLPSASEMQLGAHVVLRYFDPTPNNADELTYRIPFRVIRAESYDFVLSSRGLDVFIPPNPMLDDESNSSDERGRAEILRMYKFRETGRPPIGLPGFTVAGTERLGKRENLISISQLTNPTGAYQIHEEWAKALSGNVIWWLTGSAYRGLMHQLPRIIASLWYEAVAWPKGSTSAPEAGQTTIASAFHHDGPDLLPLEGGSRPLGLRKLLEERTETRLPRNMVLRVLQVNNGPTAVPGIPPEEDPPTRWDPYDVMITNHGLFFPDPTEEIPTKDELLSAIEAGTAGNPVFTDSGV